MNEVDTTQQSVKEHQRHSRLHAGFTMAEMLAVIAIMAVIAGLVFVSLTNITRDMQQVELDGTAREIFIVAQNHLSMAESEGLVSKSGISKGAQVSTSLLTQDENDSKGDIYYFAVDGANFPSASSASVLSLMLPYGAIDETVRVQGTYVIKYNAKTATVLSVFYAPEQPATLFTASTSDFKFSDDDYVLLYPTYEGETNDKKQLRRAFTNSAKETAMIGYYGGTDRAGKLAPPTSLKRPLLDVYNDERLVAIVENPMSLSDTTQLGLTLQLLITGESSGNTVSVDILRSGQLANTSIVEQKASIGRYRVYLDEIALSGDGPVYHFADLFGSGGSLVSSQAENSLIPGENITLQVKMFGTKAQTNIAQSAKVTTNSLFNSQDSDSKTVRISSVRHLENLAKSVSGFDPSNAAWGADNGPARAEQVADLSWTKFRNAIAEPFSTETSEYEMSSSELVKGANTVEVLKNGESAPSDSVSSFIPVDAPEGFTYTGAEHSISDVDVEAAGDDAGIFGAYKKGRITDLEIVNCKVASAQSQNAGALAGSLEGAEVENVLVRNDNAIDDSDYKITGGANVGGLVGNMAGGSITNCAAAVYVSASGSGASAGGLVGSASDSALILQSYSGGHTVGGTYSVASVNVSAPAGSAGGLVGTLIGTVKDCYSTCSASGVTAGGLVGALSSGAITSTANDACYATGMVYGTTKEGALVGTNSGSVSGRYLETVNPEIGGVGSGASGGTPADSSAFSYRALSGNGQVVPYDKTAIESYRAAFGNNPSPTLSVVYDNKYPFLNISELIGAQGEALEEMPKHLKTHYGDWPALETITQNQRL